MTQNVIKFEVQLNVKKLKVFYVSICLFCNAIYVLLCYCKYCTVRCLFTVLNLMCHVSIDVQEQTDDVTYSEVTASTKKQVQMDNVSRYGTTTFTSFPSISFHHCPINSPFQRKCTYLLSSMLLICSSEFADK